MLLCFVAQRLMLTLIRAYALSRSLRTHTGSSAACANAELLSVRLCCPACPIHDAHSSANTPIGTEAQVPFLGGRISTLYCLGSKVSSHQAIGAGFSVEN